MSTDIIGLHHAAYRCRNSEATRQFYEDFLELPLVEALSIGNTATGRETRVLHTFFQMANGGCIAFFETPGQPFDFKEQHDFDLHIALEVTHAVLERMLEKGRRHAMEVRGPSDHGFIHSIYFRDPNGYVVELAAPVEGASDNNFNPAKAREVLNQWTAEQQ